MVQIDAERKELIDGEPEVQVNGPTKRFGDRRSLKSAAGRCFITVLILLALGLADSKPLTNCNVNRTRTKGRITFIAPSSPTAYRRPPTPVGNSTLPGPRPRGALPDHGCRLRGRRPVRL